MSEVIRIDVPETTDAIFTNDGRVFYSLDRLIEDFKPAVDNQVKAAEVFKDDMSKGIAAGMQSIMTAIKKNNEVLALDAAFDE